MTPDVAEKIKQNPKFEALVSKRTGFACKLSIIMLVIYYTFILLIAFSPQTLGTPIGSNVMTLGIPVGVGIILSAFALTGIYVHRANTEFDVLTNAIKKELEG
jgi:uncharacterized membrane protein (DUF485 family)